MFGSILFLLCISLICAFCAIGGLLLVRRYVDHATLTGHHDVASALLTIVGTLYAVVLGLIVVGSLNTFNAARLTVAQEANALHNIFHLAEGLPPPTGSDLRAACLGYAKTMIDDEWQTMESAKASPHAHRIMIEFWKTIVKFEPATQRQTDLHNAILSEIKVLADNRHTRLTAAQPVYDWIIWSVLLFGGCILVIFTYFFGVENLAVQCLMTALVTIALCLNLSIVALFGYPYSGDVKVAPAPFQYDINIFREELESAKTPG
jgi:hypothetical protein